MKRTIRLFLKIIAGFFAFIIFYLLSVYFIPFIGVNSNKESKEEVTIYILTNGVHTDIVCPVRNEQVDWSEFVSFEHTLSQQTDFSLVAFGWGDKGFYLNTPEWKDLKFSTAFKAAFWLGEAAVHVTFHKGLKEGEDCKKIKISHEEYEKLVEYIKNSFSLDSENRTILIPTDAVYGKNDAFYEAKGRYNLFFSCNTWANDALKTADQKAALWTVSDTGIFQQYE